MTDDEVAAIISEHFGNIERDICPICKATIERQVQVGRCVYAQPCNHRLYQGTVDDRYKPVIPAPQRMKGF